MRGQHVQAFDPIGHAAAGEIGAERLDGVALTQIAVVALHTVSYVPTSSAQAPSVRICAGVC